MQKTKVIHHKAFMVFDDLTFSITDCLSVMTKKSKEIDRAPAKKCARKEKNEKTSRKKRAFLPLEIYFKAKQSEKKKNTNPRLFDTEIAP